MTDASGGRLRRSVRVAGVLGVLLAGGLSGVARVAAATPASLPAGQNADARVQICFNYACQNLAEVRFSAAQLQQVADQLDNAIDAADEREWLARVIGQMLAWAGEQTPIAADRGGNYADDGVHGRMDCIDHATTTTALLRLLEQRGWLRWHRVLEPERRLRLVLFAHWSAVIEAAEHPPWQAEAQPLAAQRFVVDSWFFDNGRPAVILPLAAWLDGEGPDVE